MALSADEIECLIADLHHQYSALSREYSETRNLERKDEISDIMASVDYQISRLEEQWAELNRSKVRAAGALS